jgi:chemotaxis protein methyltransferase CheR
MFAVSAPQDPAHRVSAARSTGLAQELAGARARLEAQERQIRELNHRVANSLQLATDLLIFEQLRSRDAGAQAALEASRARLVAVGELHRYLSSHSGEDSVDIGPFLSGLCGMIGETTGLTCAVRAAPLRVPAGMAQQLAIAVNELAINTAKHAYDHPGGRLDVTCAREGRDVVLIVADAGKGLGEARRPGGLGMSIVTAIVRDLNGTLTVRGDAGAAFTIRAPLPDGATPSSRSFEAWLST